MKRLRDGRQMWELSEDKATLWRNLQVQRYQQQRGRVSQDDVAASSMRLRTFSGA